MERLPGKKNGKNPLISRGKWLFLSSPILSRSVFSRFLRIIVPAGLPFFFPEPGSERRVQNAAFRNIGF